MSVLLDPSFNGVDLVLLVVAVIIAAIGSAPRKP